jgi:hypothetical protein
VKYKSEKFGLNSKVTVSLQSEKKQGFSSSLDNKFTGEASGSIRFEILSLAKVFMEVFRDGSGSKFFESLEATALWISFSEGSATIR